MKKIIDMASFFIVELFRKNASILITQQLSSYGLTFIFRYPVFSNHIPRGLDKKAPNIPSRNHVLFLPKVIFFTIVALFALLLISACSGGGNGSSGSNRDVLGENGTRVDSVSFSYGESLPLLTESIGPSGGVIRIENSGTPLDGVEISVPSGVLQPSTLITVGTNSGKFDLASDPLANVVLEIEISDGQDHFDKPLLITIPYDHNYEAPIPFYITDDGKARVAQRIDSDQINGVIKFHTYHASAWSWLIPEAKAPEFYLNTGFDYDDQFSVVNNGSSFGRRGECWGMAAFSLWYFENIKETEGPLRPRFNTKLGYEDWNDDEGLKHHNNRTIQDVIATRAHVTQEYIWNDYLLNNVHDRKSATLYSDEQNYKDILSIMRGLGRPVILYLFEKNGEGRHSVVAYEIKNYEGTKGEIGIYDPNYPGKKNTITYDFKVKKWIKYRRYDGIAYFGDGTFNLDKYFKPILAAAKKDFDGSGNSVIKITSHSNGAGVFTNKQQIKGYITGGQVSVDNIAIYVGEITSDPMLFNGAVDESGHFQVDVVLNSGINYLQFISTGKDVNSLEDKIVPNNMASVDFVLTLKEIVQSDSTSSATDIAQPSNGEGANSAPKQPDVSAPSSAKVNESISVRITRGSDADGDDVKVSCEASGGNPSRFELGYGKGGSSESKSLSYNSAGRKTITCTSFDRAGADSKPTSVIFNIEQNNRAPATPNIDLSPSHAEINQRITLVITRGKDLDNDQVKVSCTATGSNKLNPFEIGFGAGGTTGSTTLQYGSAGEKSIRCVSIDNKGASDGSTTRKITIKAPANREPRQPGIRTPSSAKVNERISVRITRGSDDDGDDVKVSCEAPGSNDTRFELGYGRGGSSESKSLSYNSAGRKTITCTSFDRAGADSKTTSVTVNIEKDNQKNGLCESYAYAAISQYNENVSVGCGFDDDKWHSDFSGHYNWCMSPGVTSATLDREMNNRDAQLQQCKSLVSPSKPPSPAPVPSPPPLPTPPSTSPPSGSNNESFCRYYTDKQEEQVAENNRLGCGFSGPRWGTDKVRTYNWCMTHIDMAQGEMDARESMLQSCRR